MIRFVHLFNYPAGVSRADGEKWYLGTHVPAVRKLPGVRRYRSWPQVNVGIPYPSSGAPAPFDQFVRRSELCFDDYEAWRAAYRSAPGLWTPAREGTAGFGPFECMLLGEEPQFDLLRDAPPQHYKYVSLQLEWPKGPPEADDDAEIFINSYCFRYGPKISFAAGEDWYLGHHTREGKQLPGMKHYRTWRSLHVAEEAGAPFQPNKWVRLTELGMSPAAYIADMVADETRIRFTPSPFGAIIGAWINISIKQNHVDDFLK
ncbi:MAG TPA: EthD domain-containing protein [Candidatus Binataceae bacterium]|nr:EthD domain-containing protein [Candidatus Binataceae bacterium]